MGAGRPAGAEQVRVARVVPDVTGVDRQFDYSVPDELRASVVVGSIVRVPLQGRRVRGWVVATSEVPTTTVPLRDVVEIVSLGPSPEVVAAAGVAAWRYAGRMRPLLVTASPPRIVRALPCPGAGVATSAVAPLHVRAVVPSPALAAAALAAVGSHRAVVRLPPLASRLELVLAVLGASARLRATGDALVLVPERRDAEILTRRLARLDYDVALHPDDWAGAAAGGRVVVGTRTAALATTRSLAVVLVLDAHAQAYVEQRSPTWDATVVVAERAERAGVPCVLASPCPTVDHLAWGELVALPRAVERSGWPPVQVLDRRGEDPRSGLYSPLLAPLLTAAIDSRPDIPAVCVLNRTGRARLLACGSCGAVVACERCAAALLQRHRPAPGETAELDCPRCAATGPALCRMCGSTRLKLLRAGVGRVAEELGALTGRNVAEVSGRPHATDHSARGVLTRGDQAHGDQAGAAVLVGTQAVLHRVRAASVVVFLDLDQELLAPRYRAAEQALALVALASRLVGNAGRAAGAAAAARVVLQTRLPDHEVVRAAVHADPGIVSAAESPRRDALGLPPARALARLSGPGAGAFAEALDG
ncbi:MAG: primosomal protein N' family DNA-binding protein, partial [Acidimicrobiales bacterium]